VNRIPIEIWALALVSISLSAAAQILMKLGMIDRDATAAEALVDKVLAVALNPYVVAGLGCYGLSAALWLVVLSKLPLSAAYPLVALAIVMVIVASNLLLGEVVSPIRIAGSALIVLGVVLVGLGG